MAKFTPQIGLNADTGESLSDTDHLRQSLRNIILTPKLQRVMRRDYGSDIYESIDQATTPGLVLKIYAQITNAIETFEPRFKLYKINVALVNDQPEFTFKGDYVGSSVSLVLSGVEA